jgi:hypothetical protein
VPRFRRHRRPLGALVALLVLAVNASALAAASPHASGIHEAGSPISGLHHCADEAPDAGHDGGGDHPAHDCCHVHAGSLALPQPAGNLDAPPLSSVRHRARARTGDGRLADAPPLPPPNA